MRGFFSLVPLAVVAHQVRPFHLLVADAGCNSEANRRFCREHLGVESLIAAKKRRSGKVIARTRDRREMVEALGPPGDPTNRRAYGQRCNAETLVSVIKRKSGEALSARFDRSQCIQALLRGVVYNLYRLIRLRQIRVPAG